MTAWHQLARDGKLVSKSHDPFVPTGHEEVKPLAAPDAPAPCFTCGTTDHECWDFTEGYVPSREDDSRHEDRCCECGAFDHDCDACPVFDGPADPS